MDLTHRKHPPKPFTAAVVAQQKQRCPDFTSSSRSKPIHRLSRTSSRSEKPQRVVDTDLQIKAMSISETPSSSETIIVRPNHLNATISVEKKPREGTHMGGLTKSALGLGFPKANDKDFHVTTINLEKPDVCLDLGGRRLLGSSTVELANFLTCNAVKVVSVDMPPSMQMHAVDCARKTRDSLEKFSSRTLAQTLKMEFDGAYGQTWHCVVGNSFGSFVTHSIGGFMYFSIDQKLYVLLFKTNVQRSN